MRPARLLAPLCALLMLFALVSAPPAAAYDVAVHDSTADRSRTFKAYQREAGTLFKVRFRTTVPNEKRRVMARINVTVPSTISDPFLVSTYSMYCAPAGTNRGDNKILGSQNVHRGRTRTHNPHYLYTAPIPGAYECWIRISSGRPRPSSSRVSSNVLHITGGSFLQVTNMVHPGSGQGYTPRTPSKLVTWHKAADTAVMEVNAPLFTDHIKVSGDLWLTSCTAKEGSTDPVTGKRLCEGRINRAGTTLISKAVVMQRKITGDGYCKVSHFPSKSGRTTHITNGVHHRMVFENGVANISRDLSCSRQVRIKIYVKHLSGGALVIHNQGTITTGIMPKGSTV